MQIRHTLLKYYKKHLKTERTDNVLPLPKNFESYADARKNGFLKMKELKESGQRIVGAYCTLFLFLRFYRRGNNLRRKNKNV